MKSEDREQVLWDKLEAAIMGGDLSDAFVMMIILRRKIWMIDDEEELLEFITPVIESNPDKVLMYLSGKESVIGFFVGQVMKACNKRGEPATIKRLVERELTLVEQ